MSGGTMTGPTTAPAAPGRLGEAIDAAPLLAYLEALGRWRDDRRAELDRIDAAALRAEDPDSFTGDLTLALTLWQAVTDRLTELVTAWDSGRVDRTQREEMSRLIWGRLGQGTLGVSLVEATRLCDAVTGSLRSRLAFDPAAAEVAARVAAVRAGLYRCTELLQQHRDLIPGAADRVDLLQRRVADLAKRATQGADVSGPFAVLEADAAHTERDLIVAASGRRDLARDRAAAQARRDELETREEALRVLAQRCAERIAKPPRLAIPDLERLGPVPAERAAVDAYQARLEQVAAALAFAESAYTAPLAERDELRGRLAAFAAKAAATGRDGDSALAAAHAAAHAVLWNAPCDVDEARRLVTAYQHLLREGDVAAAAAGTPDTRERPESRE
jgi:hypothetical protein